MLALRYLAVTVGVIALLGVGAYVTILSGSPASVSGTTTTTCITSNPSTTTTQSSTTSSVTATTPQGSFSYSPSSPVKVDSVTASTYQGSNGTMVTFAVAYENVGNSDIYYLAGCGSSLVATLAPGSDAIKQVRGGPVCLCAEAIMRLPPGGNRTAVTPGCWTVDKFLLVHPGTVQVDFALYWGSTQSNQQQDVTNITATLVFS